MRATEISEVLEDCSYAEVDVFADRLGRKNCQFVRAEQSLPTPESTMLAT